MKTIADIQRRLIALGYRPGPANGVAGPQTTETIKQYQRAHGLAADGVAGPKTIAVLFPAGKVVEEPQVSISMKTSPAGRAAITEREGNKLTAYRDSVGILTIGVGHTSAAGTPSVTPGMVITAMQSDEILSRDLAKFEAAVTGAVKLPLSQHEFDALVSLAFNIGDGAFKKSTLVKKLNAGDRAGASDAFLSWNKAGGKVLKGLTTRRAAERKQFLNA